MGVRQWWQEQRTAVQAALVVGVLFGVVVVTVVGAAVLGTFVLGVGDPVGTAPEASFSVDSGDGTVTVAHGGGESVDPSALTLEVGDRTVSWSPPDGSVDEGDEVVVEDVESGTEVRLLWTGEDGEETVLLDYVV